MSDKNNEIDPSKTPVFFEKKELTEFKYLHSLIPMNSRDIKQLLNTCQWLFEVVDRQEDASDWWLINAPEELQDKYMLEVHGLSKEDREKSLERLNAKMKNILNEMREGKEKGEFNGECNRTACNNNPANFFNHSTKKYYCGSCALKINEYHADAMRLYGHDLCTISTGEE